MSKRSQILLYTTPTCPHCRAAKKILDSKGAVYTEIDVSNPTLRAMLVRKAQGCKTVPQIFIGDLHVGGFDDLSALDKTGELDHLLQAMAAA